MKVMSMNSLKRIIEMRGKECSGCSKKSDYIRKVLEVQHLDPIVEFKSPHGAQYVETLEDYEYLKINPKFLNDDQRERRQGTIIRMTKMGFDMKRNEEQFGNIKQQLKVVEEMEEKDLDTEGIRQRMIDSGDLVEEDYNDREDWEDLENFSDL